VCNPLQAQMFFGELARTLDVVYGSERFRPVL
jgi:hypothetical protein